MKFTYYGHACFAVEAGEKTLLFDPFITPNPLAEKIDAKKIAADFILISHGHGDHVADVVAIAQRTGATIIAPFEVGSWFEKKGLENVQSMNHGGAARTPFGRVKLTAAIHSSSMPDGSYGGNPAGFVIETERWKFLLLRRYRAHLRHETHRRADRTAFCSPPDRRLLHHGNRRRAPGRGLCQGRRKLSVCTTIPSRRSSSTAPPR